MVHLTGLRARSMRPLWLCQATYSHFGRAVNEPDLRFARLGSAVVGRPISPRDMSALNWMHHQPPPSPGWLAAFGARYQQ